MTNSFSVSIIVPVYNVREYIIKCLESVASQTYRGTIECLIVDDCGPDDSIDLAEHFIHAYNGPIDFRIVHREKNGGLSAARNTGTKEAQGEYVYFLDSDDWISPDCIEILSNHAMTGKYDVVIGGYDVVGPDPGFLKLNLEGVLSGNDRIFEAFSRHSFYGMAWNKLYRVEYLLQENLWFCEGLIHEDDLWSYQVARTANSLCCVDKTTYFYRMRQNSIVNSGKIRNDIYAFVMVSQEMQKFEELKSMDSTYWEYIYEYSLWVLGRCCKAKCFILAMEAYAKMMRKPLDSYIFNKWKDNSLYFKILNINMAIHPKIGSFFYILRQLGNMSVSKIKSLIMKKR